MSILVMGATNTVQQHIQVTGQVRDQVSGQAVAEAAFALALQQLVASGKREPGIQRGSYEVQGLTVEVEAAPLNGWISLGTANAELLARVFAVGADLPAAQAQALAEDVVAWRDDRPEESPDELRNSGVNKHLFESVDDLMLVPGMDYEVLARVRPLLVTDLRAGTRVNPLAAPPEVLAVLADGNQAVVAQITEGRERGATEVDTSRLERNAVQSSSTDHYRLHADIPLEAGKILRVTQDVALGSTHSKVAPWRVLRQSRQVQAVGP
jgi:general secretion pathway protein K